MTALQLNTEIYRSLGIISEDESMLKKVAKYLSRVAGNMTNSRAKTDDPTLMSKEAFYARIAEAEKSASRTFANVEELDKYIRSL
jgi:hypothetical protein